MTAVLVIAGTILLVMVAMVLVALHCALALLFDDLLGRLFGR